MLFEVIKYAPMRVWIVVMQGVVAFLKKFYGICVGDILPPSIESLPLLVSWKLLLAVSRHVLIDMPDA